MDQDLRNFVNCSFYDQELGMWFRSDHYAYRCELQTLAQHLVPFVPVTKSDNNRRRLIGAYWTKFDSCLVKSCFLLLFCNVNLCDVLVALWLVTHHMVGSVRGWLGVCWLR